MRSGGLHPIARRRICIDGPTFDLLALKPYTCPATFGHGRRRFTRGPANHLSVESKGSSSWRARPMKLFERIVAPRIRRGSETQPEIPIFTHAVF